MTSLFVDVDDTLVLWDLDTPNPCGIYDGTKYVINDRLVRGIVNFYVNNPYSLIVVWSGGGRQYAREWVEKLGLGDMAVPLGKDRQTLKLIEPGDVVIDDEPVTWKTHSPMEWPNM